MAEQHFYHVGRDGGWTEVATVGEALAARGKEGYVWLDFVAPARESLEALVAPFGLHPLAIEDCLDENQVPKLEDFPDNTFILFNRFQSRDNEFVVDEVDFFLGRSFLITVARAAPDPASQKALEAAFRIERADIARGPDYLLHVILDRIVDDKLQAIEMLQDSIDSAEEAALEKGSAAFDPTELMRLRRNLLGIRKSLFHEREILVKICRRDSPFITEAAIYSYRDIYDHLVRFAETVEVCREMIGTLLELHLSLVNNELAVVGNRTNQVVRRLTFITTVFMPLSFLAGVGGMSEWSMMTGPENWRLAYPAFLLVMAAIGTASYFILKLIERRGLASED